MADKFVKMQNVINEEVDESIEEKNSNLEKIMKLLVVILVISLLITAGLGAYSLLSYEHASPVITDTAETYDYKEEASWYLFSTNKNNDNTAIFFYPQAKLEEKAYFYLANMLQRRGYDVFIAKSLFHQPVFSLSHVDKAMEKYPKYKAWILGGHGNGTDAVNRYLQNDEAKKITGSFFLGALPNEKVVALNTPIFIAIGSMDTLFPWEEYEKNQARYFTANTEILIIDGGNYTNFGYYDLAYNDSTGTITPKMQQDIVANRIDKFIDSKI